MGDHSACAPSEDDYYPYPRGNGPRPPVAQPNFFFERIIDLKLDFFE